MKDKIKQSKSYWIEPNGILHEVQKWEHIYFAQDYLEKNYPDIMSKYNNLAISASDCADFLVAKFKWIAFTPLGANTNISYIGRLKDEPDMIVVKFTKEQIYKLEKLWEVNDYEQSWLNKILNNNENDYRDWND
jgi:hypothetical protein